MHIVCARLLILSRICGRACRWGGMQGMQRKMRAGRWMEGADDGKFGRKEGVGGGDLSAMKLRVAK